MSGQLLCGIDVGTSGVRVLLTDPAGRLVASMTAEHPLLTPQPGWTEQNPEDWWSGVVDCLRRIDPALLAQVAAVGLTGQMHGSVLLDGGGRVIRPALLWNDQRTVAEVEQIEQAVGHERLIALTGNVALTGFTAPKLLWVRRHEPEAFARVAHVMLPKDYVRFRLTGAVATDMADGSGTLLMDVQGRRWSPEVLDALGLPARILPELFEGPEVTGTVTADAARLTGLSQAIPVVAGGGDQAAGAVGVGVVAEGAVSCSIGTSGVVFAGSAHYRALPDGRLHAFCHSAPGRWHLMGVMLSAGGSLRWLRDKLYGPGTPYPAIMAEAASVAPGAEGLLFLPYLTGERTPYADPYARGAFVGLGLEHGRAHMARAVLEGIAFGLADSLDLVRGAGVAPQEVLVTGGGARSPGWLEIIASAFGLPLRRLAVDEGPAFGAAVLAAVGAGLHRDADTACAAMVRTADRVDPTPGLQEAYAGLHPVYSEAYRGLFSTFRRLAR